MNKIYLQDGGIIDASSSQEFVTQLREGSKFDSCGTNDEFMKRFAERFEIASGLKPDLRDEDSFIKSLKELGYITKIE